MLDDNDIEKLKEVFATKDDLKESFASKQDIENLIDIVVTKEDSKSFAKKDDLEKIDKRLSGIASKEDIQKLSKQLSSLSEDLKVNGKLETRVDYIENVLAIKKN
jgi:hypothetical protein